jgi:hypothetical protein
VTRALIVEVAGGEQGAKLRSQVTRWHPGATRDQVEDAFESLAVGPAGDELALHHHVAGLHVDLVELAQRPRAILHHVGNGVQRCA